MADERDVKVGDDTPVFNPAAGAEIPVTVAKLITVTIPDKATKTIQLVQAPPGNEQPDPNFRINGVSASQVTLDSNGVGKFRVRYAYPSGTTAQPDVTRTVATTYNNLAIPGGEVGYDYIVRDAFVTVEPGTPDFAVLGPAPLAVQLHIVNGVGDPIGGATVRASCDSGNARFLDATGTDVTQVGQINGSEVFYYDYTTSNVLNTPGYGIAKAEFTALNTGIFDIKIQVSGFNESRLFTLVVTDDQVAGGGLPPPRLSFSSTLNLDGPATTFVRLASIPAGVSPDKKVALVVNGNPAAPFDLTMQQFTTVGYELPKRWFMQKTIDDSEPNGKASLYYMVQSLDDDATYTRSNLLKFSTTGTVVNKPDLQVGKRTLPMPTVSGVIVVNSSVLESGTLPVEIDFTNSGVSPGIDGYLTVYANGYSSNASTVIDNVQTVPQSFKTQAGKMVVNVDATLLWGFTTSSTGVESRLMMDYYLVSTTLEERSEAGSDFEDPQQRELGKKYSLFLEKGWTIMTPVHSI